MVVGPKLSLTQVPSKGRISIMKIQNFTVQKRHSVVRVVYGGLLIAIGLITIIVDPLTVFTDWFLDIKEGTFLFHMWETPTYKLYSEVWVYNYTNWQQFLNGDDSKLRLQEIGPFRYQEIRTNENITIDREKGVMTMIPKLKLKFLEEESIAHSKNVQIYSPNIPLIAISTLAADKLGYLANAGAYYSIVGLGSKLFKNLTADELMWGYKDPIVTIASTFLPGWIDFGKIGIMDRFYAQKEESIEVELANKSRKYSLKSWNESPGLVEQGYKNMNTSNLCNKIEGSYEGLMLSPNYPKDQTIRLFRKQACRIYPFVFNKEVQGEYGFNYYRFKMDEAAFNRSSPYSCPCTENCLPDGFVDVSGCYYGFPIALSKPHFLDTDPQQQSYFDGMVPNEAKHTSLVDVEPTSGVPIALASRIQVNMAVRMSSGNPITRPFKDKVLPLLWISLSCREPPPEVVTILRLRFVIAPPLLITLEFFLFLIGLILGLQGFHRIWKPKYKLIKKEDDEAPRRRNSIIRKKSVAINMADNIAYKDDDDDDNLAKEAVSLLAIREEDGDYPDLLITDT